VHDCLPAPGQAAELFALHRNKPTILPKRFGQRFKGSDRRHGHLPTAHRFEAVPDARQKVATLFKDRLPLCIRDRSSAFHHPCPLEKTRQLHDP